jgi:hypothetical protein
MWGSASVGRRSEQGREGWPAVALRQPQPMATSPEHQGAYALITQDSGGSLIKVRAPSRPCVEPPCQAFLFHALPGLANDGHCGVHTALKLWSRTLVLS